jgi:hypothetical protein
VRFNFFFFNKKPFLDSLFSVSSMAPCVFFYASEVLVPLESLVADLRVKSILKNNYDYTNYLCIWYDTGIIRRRRTEINTQRTKSSSWCIKNDIGIRKKTHELNWRRRTRRSEMKLIHKGQRVVPG